MTERTMPLIIYVPGLLPKPEPEKHREALLRCLLTGLRRVDAEVAQAIEANESAFEIVSWTYDFYHEHRDISIDTEAIAAVIEQRGASAEDVAEATSWRRRLARWIYTLGDMMPFLIPHVASERIGRSCCSPTAWGPSLLTTASGNSATTHPIVRRLICC